MNISYKRKQKVLSIIYELFSNFCRYMCYFDNNLKRNFEVFETDVKFVRGKDWLEKSHLPNKKNGKRSNPFVKYLMKHYAI